MQIRSHIFNGESCPSYVISLSDVEFQIGCVNDLVPRSSGVDA